MMNFVSQLVPLRDDFLESAIRTLLVDVVSAWSLTGRKGTILDRQSLTRHCQTQIIQSEILTLYHGIGDLL